MMRFFFGMVVGVIYLLVYPLFVVSCLTAVGKGLHCDSSIICATLRENLPSGLPTC